MQKLKSNAVERTVEQGLGQMPEISENTHLKDPISVDSLALFEQPLAECFLTDLSKVRLKFKITNCFKFM